MYLYIYIFIYSYIHIFIYSYIHISIWTPRLNYSLELGMFVDLNAGVQSVQNSNQLKTNGYADWAPSTGNTGLTQETKSNQGPESTSEDIECGRAQPSSTKLVFLV